jgi:hypothetical protein
MGDWDGNGTRTVGSYEAGTFKLRNSNSAGSADVTFTFGDPRGFPVAGDFDGDLKDDVAVYRDGTWQVRLATGATSTFSFGKGTWPATIPVTGDWDGDGTDGVGTFAPATGIWTLRNTATEGPSDAGTFMFSPAPNAYPVTGDWDANGTDTVGVKGGTTWYLRNTNAAGVADASFDYGLANDLPMTYRDGHA